MPVNEYGQMIGQSMAGYTPGELPAIDFLEELLFEHNALLRNQ